MIDVKNTGEQIDTILEDEAITSFELFKILSRCKNWASTESLIPHLRALKSDQSWNVDEQVDVIIAALEKKHD